jgi:lysophospholipase L1-like esterase
VTRGALAGVVGAGLLLFVPIAVGAGHQPSSCTAPVSLVRFGNPLPNTARAVRRGRVVTIVTIGSSSTAGTGASDPSHTYPARLAEELRTRWPRLTVQVINRGVGGETAEQMLVRFERDVLPYSPQLVIWQTGSNSTLLGRDVAAYEATVRRGIAQLKAARIDIVLMDPQYAPRVLARPMHRRVIETINLIAGDLKVAVFHRHELMHHWVTSGQLTMDDMLSRDQLHMNDLGYSCIARLLADALETAAQAPAVAPDVAIDSER